jgi:hypothetical protein
VAWGPLVGTLPWASKRPLNSSLKVSRLAERSVWNRRRTSTPPSERGYGPYTRVTSTRPSRSQPSRTVGALWWGPPSTKRASAGSSVNSLGATSQSATLAGVRSAASAIQTLATVLTRCSFQP